MRIQYCTISEIQFNYKSYPQSLKDSLIKAGLNFPIIVKKENNQIICVDGHKRLSAISDLIKSNPSPKWNKIPVRFLYARSQNDQSMLNTH